MSGGNGIVCALGVGGGFHKKRSTDHSHTSSEESPHSPDPPTLLQTLSGSAEESSTNPPTSTTIVVRTARKFGGKPGNGSKPESIGVSCSGDGGDHQPSIAWSCQIKELIPSLPYSPG